MINRQRSKYDMYLLLKAYLLTIAPAIFLLMPNFSVLFDEFVTAVTQLVAHFDSQEKNREGFATYKRNMRQILEQAIIDMSATLVFYATNVGNVVLQEMVDYKDGALSKLSDADLISVGNLIKEQALLYVADLVDYDVTVVSIALFGDKVENFVNAKSQPRDGIYDKSEATVAIKVTILAIDAILEKMDKAVRHLRSSQRLFHTQYFDRRRIVEAPRRILSARGKVTDIDGNVLAMVIISCEALGLRRKTSAKGRFQLKLAPPGEYIFIFSRPGFQTVSQSVFITEGLRAEVNVIMLAHVNIIPV